MKQIVVAAIIVIVLLMSNSSYSRYWYVTADGTGDAPTISAAIDSFNVGDLGIFVAPGVYLLSSPIYISNSDPDSLNISADFGYGNPFPIIDCSVSGCGFVIEGRDSKLLLIWGFEIINASNAAISINQASNNPISITTNLIHSNPGHGVLITQSSDVFMMENILYSNLIGVACVESGRIEINRNTIAYHNGVQACGLYMDGACLANLVTGNIICNNQAIQGVNEENSIFECNDIFNNTINLDLYIGVDGNFAEDPKFCSSTPQVDGNFFIQSDSPCWLKNHPNGDLCGLIGTLSIGCEPVGTEERSWGNVKGLMKSSSNSR